MSFYKIHDIHPYHAKFYPGIPQYFLSKYATRDSVVLDPFCGSGTTLLECNAAGIRSVGIDINFLSAKISACKTFTYASEKLNSLIEYILAADDSTPIEFPDANIWFTAQNLDDLFKIFNAIQKIEDLQYRTLFEVVLSSLLNKTCNKRDTWNLGYLSDNILPNKDCKLSLRNEFVKKCKWLVGACNETANLKNISKVICGNSKIFSSSELFDLVITSPPYPFAVDFAKNNRLAYYIFGQNLIEAADNETGARCKRNKRDCEMLFFEEIKDIYLNVIKQVRVGGYFCMTVADTKRNNKPIYFVAWLKELFSNNGWFIVEDEIRQLERQSMGQKRIPEEHVLVFQRNS